MAQLGNKNELRVSRISPYSTFLDGGDLGEVMLLRDSNSLKPEIGDKLTVFVYIDTDDTLVATTDQPQIVAGQCGSLQVVSLTQSGAFLDWGLKSDLFLPRSEQMGNCSVGSQCVVVALVDEGNQRMIASSRLYNYLDEENDRQFAADQQVDLIVSQRTDMGYRAVVNGTHLGMLYHNEIFKDLRPGDAHKGYVKALRDDGKIDLILQKPSIGARSTIENKILQNLKKNGGISHLTDKSPPAEIYKTYGISKKAYKHALGALYKSRLILLSKEQISLVDKSAGKGV